MSLGGFSQEDVEVGGASTTMSCFGSGVRYWLALSVFTCDGSYLSNYVD